MEAEITSHAIDNALAIQEKSKEIDISLLEAMCKRLIMDNHSGSYGNRIKLILLWLAVGRTGEVANCSWKHSHWNNRIGNLQMSWREDKTGHEYMMNFFPDAKGYTTCYLHAFACYFVMGGGTDLYNSDTEREHDWIFPDLAGVMVPSKSILKLQT